jgi:hypothetical protein
MRSPYFPGNTPVAEGILLQSKIELNGLEVTQAIQNMAHSVPLVANKTTVVRAYLSTASGVNAVTVRGELQVSRTPDGSSQIIPSMNVVRINPNENGQLQAKREDVNLSLNFLLPTLQTTPGSLFIKLTTVTDAQTGKPLPISNHTSALEVNFQESPPLNVRVIGLRYEAGSPPEVYIPTTRDFALIKSWLKRAYPVADVLFSQTIVQAEARIKPPLDSDTYSNAIYANAQITAMRNQDVNNGTDRRTHYYGLIADGGGFVRGRASGIPTSPDPATVASGPTGSADFGWDRDGSYGDWYTGHELGHTFGRFHPGFCNQSANDPSYPFINGQLSNDGSGFVGFDVGDPELGIPMKALSGQTWHDVMTYCDQQWLSSYTYEGIRQRLIAENSIFGGSAGTTMDAAPTNQESFINVVATVNLSEGSGDLLYVNPVVGLLRPQNNPSQNVLLRLVRSDGSVILNYPVEVKLDSCREGNEQQIGLVDALLPKENALSRIELVIEGTVVDTFQASGRAVRGTPSIQRVVSAPDAGIAFAWEQANETGTYTVQVSTDQGETWQVVTIGSDTPNVVLDRNQLAGKETIMLRVTATDGYNSTTTTSEQMSVDSL